jgi:hypothetical protein
MSRHVFDGQLFARDEDALDSWVFVALPSELSDRIDEELTGPPRGFGSVRVEVSIGSTEWRTSIFPSKQQATYVLPVKKAVRTAEAIEPGDVVTFTLDVLD